MPEYNSKTDVTRFVNVFWPPRDTVTLILAYARRLIDLNKNHWQFTELEGLSDLIYSMHYFEWEDSDPNNLFFKPARMSIGDDDCVWFSDGRHRTLWMIQEGFDHLPLLIAHTSIAKAGEMGLIKRILNLSDKIKIPNVNIDYLVKQRERQNSGCLS